MMKTSTLRQYVRVCYQSRVQCAHVRYLTTLMLKHTCYIPDDVGRTNYVLYSVVVSRDSYHVSDTEHSTIGTKQHTNTVV